MLAYYVGLCGMWVFCDGLASLWAYTNHDKKGGQTWLRDHSLRIIRTFLGIANAMAEQWGNEVENDIEL